MESNILTQKEIADRWGVSRQRINAMKKSKGFPAPAGKVGRSEYWTSKAVREYEKNNMTLRKKMETID